MHYKAILFDLDGTLLDTLEDLRDSVNHALAAVGFSTRTLEEVRQFVGNGVRRLVERAVPAGTSPDALEQCFSLFKAHYAQNSQNKTAPYPGILPLLTALKAHGIRAAVVSNKLDEAVQALCAAYFGSLIACAAGESETMRKKPAPDGALHVLRTLGVSREEALYVGDSDVDIRTAENAGLACVCVTWGFRSRAFLEAAGGTRFIDTPEALLALL